MAHGNAHSNPFDISAPGAFAGGLEAFENFFKHMPAEAGTAFVIVHHIARDHRPASLMTRAARPSLVDGKPISIRRPDEPAPTRVSFSDNGIGLAEENLKENFRAFKRLHVREYPGGDIGVLLRQKLAERYEGRMRAESEYGHETTFHFRIPA